VDRLQKKPQSLCLDPAFSSQTTEGGHVAFASTAGLEDDLLMEWSNRIFEKGFDTIFGLSVGRNGCPFM
jgi:hypothetical protein